MERLRPLAKAILSGLVVALGLFAVLSAVNAGQGFRDCAGTAPFGWTLTLLASLVIGAVALVLLGQPDAGSDSPDVETKACPGCGKLVLGDWRLCPHCGHRFDTEEDDIVLPEPPDGGE